MTHVVYLLFGALLTVVSIATYRLAGELFVPLVMKDDLKYTPIGLLVRVCISTVGALLAIALFSFLGCLAIT